MITFKLLVWDATEEREPKQCLSIKILKKNSRISVFKFCNFGGTQEGGKKKKGRVILFFIL
jgi:hypothetical protein